MFVAKIAEYLDVFGLFKHSGYESHELIEEVTKDEGNVKPQSPKEKEDGELGEVEIRKGTNKNGKETHYVVPVEHNNKPQQKQQ